MNKTNDIDQLIYLFSKLPGLGIRSARRIVLYLLQDKDVRLKSLINHLIELDKKIVKCEICGNMDTKNICHICSSEHRDKSTIAIVETVAELCAMERSGNFKGLYHVLGHNLSAASRQNPRILRLPELLKRCFVENIKEVIIATNSTLEGQTTAYFIIEYLKEHPAKISRLASGIPIGGELDYLDEGTLSAAINLRQPCE
ncbi:recombination mediator RecR [Rickettsia typhi]|uniref:Recombination protein RecR n=2 Tax=Rickettsia typhi TaxID=785 RepID=RECR_RICTY|nr:recombination mediator RecR [Rickettsia typhi]Q68WU0.1 RecName: Full=Recombination protein RecR [Rickettsia typhi str. Wilmington]AAU03902.1 recombination protein RecR [Rickettsia typhi str. Wilmington]AFE54283.1 recombination protein RecR [Rickettsia typhi str. TH1527]AFE55123.1 recombination protein RecR [Rickettsia typhi str. B9991CWPP]